jgi:hypothetical protein
MAKADILADELDNDPAALDYSTIASNARAASPNDSGAQDVAIANALNVADRVAETGEAAPCDIIGAFAPEEWAASRALDNATVIWLFDRIMTAKSVTLGPDTNFEQGLALLIALGTLTQQRADAIRDALLAMLPRVSRAEQLSLDFITPSDVADARRVIGNGTAVDL